jgi:hypothetical protein
MVVVGCLLLAGSASADYVTDYEALNANASGVILTGQDSYYIPAGTTSVDFLAYTYAGNTLGIPQNPTGGTKFIGGTGPGGTIFARAQRDVTFGAGVWTHAYDFCVVFNGTPPAANNCGSFSSPPPPPAAAPSDYIDLFSWVTGQEGLLYKSYYLPYNAAGIQAAQPGIDPGPAWNNLAVFAWYRATTIINYDTNQIIEVKIKDLGTNVESSFVPAGDWYLEGGSNGSTTTQAGIRFFGGGSVAGNTAAFDNTNIVAGLTTPVAATTWGAIKATFSGSERRAAAPRSIPTAYFPEVN